MVCAKEIEEKLNRPVNEETPEEELLASVAGHKEEALGDLYDRVAPRLAGMLSRILPARGQAEEILQEIFKRLWDDAEQLAASQGSVAAWLMITARQLRKIAFMAANDARRACSMSPFAARRRR